MKFFSIFASACALLLICTLLCWAPQDVNAETVEFGVRLDTSLTMNIDPDNILLEVAPIPEGREVSGEITIDVSTNNPTGYTLSMSTKTDVNALRHESGVNAEITPTTHTQTAGSLANNTWGYNFSGNIQDGYLTVPSVTESVDLVVTNDLGLNHETHLTFGAKVNMGVPAGIYSNELVFTAVANYVPGIGIFSISPDNGSTSGGDEVLITGYNFLKGRVNITKVAASMDVALAIDDQGNLYSWGYDWYGQVGDGELTANHVEDSIEVMAPIRLTGLDTGATYVNQLKDARIVDIAVGYRHCMALDDEGNVYAWGDDSSGEIGDGDNSANHVDYGGGDYGYVLAPLKISGLDTGQTDVNEMINANIKSISASSSSSAVDSDGNLYIWGQQESILSSMGISGKAPINFSALDTDIDQDQSRVNILMGVEVKKAAAGLGFLVIDKDDKLYGWGNVVNFMLDDFTFHDSGLPAEITDLEISGNYSNHLKGAEIKDAVTVAGSGNALVLDYDGNLYAWGQDGYYGQIGDGLMTINHQDGSPTGQVVAPLKLTGLDTSSTGYDNALKDARISNISISPFGGYAVDQEGNLYAWGGDGGGAIGDGELTHNHQDGNPYGPVLAPIKITGLNPGGTYANQLGDNPVSYVTGAGNTTFAIDNSKDLYVWGNDPVAGLGANVDNRSENSPSNIMAPVNLSRANTGSVFSNAIYYTNSYSFLVHLGTAQCNSVKIISDNTLSCITSAHAAGTVDVTLSDRYDTATLPAGFTYR